MAPNTIWFLFLGLLLLSAALLRTCLKDVAVSTSLVYFLVGIAAGPLGLDIISLTMDEPSVWLEHITEAAVVASLFTSGLKLHIKLTGDFWSMPIKLATSGMVLSVAFLAAVAYFLLDLPLGAAILLGAILSPTDPVLASDVQVEEVNDKDKLRFTLTGEGCLNDGTAFPFVILGLGLLGFHDLGAFGYKWILRDVIWASVAGLGLGYGLGLIVGKLVEYISMSFREKIEADEFLALGLIALAYGTALLIGAYGFLAVFAAGFAFRNIDKKGRGARFEKERSGVSDAVLGFNEQLERILEIIVVLIFGAMFHMKYFFPSSLLFGLILLFVCRPLSTAISLWGEKRLKPLQKGFVHWFGVRGVGSLYYYFYAMNHELNPEYAKIILAVTYVSIFFSLVCHGFSVTPLMRLYQRAARAD